MTLNKRERFIAILTGLVLGGALVYLIVLAPMLSRLDEANRQIDDANAQLLKANDVFKNDLTARKRWKELSGIGLKADASASEGQLLDRVRDAAQNAGLSVQSLKPAPAEKVTGFSRITLRVNATGSMARIGRFLHDLRGSKMPLRILDLQVSSRKGGTDDLAIQLSVATIFESPQAPQKVAASNGANREVIR